MEEQDDDLCIHSTGCLRPKGPALENAEVAEAHWPYTPKGRRLTPKEPASLFFLIIQFIVLLLFS